MLGWIIEPIARRLGRGSAADGLVHLREAVALPRQLADRRETTPPQRPRTRDVVRRSAAGEGAGHHLLDSFAASDAPDLVDATLGIDVHNYLPDDLLVKVEIATWRMGSRHGLPGPSAEEGVRRADRGLVSRGTRCVLSISGRRLWTARAPLSGIRDTGGSPFCSGAAVAAV